MNIPAYLSVILKNVIYGASVYFVGSLSENADALDILAIRFLISFAALYLLKILKICKINVSYKDFFRKTERSRFVLPLLFAALFEPVLYMTFETLGISMTTAITTGVILSLMPISSCISETLILKEKATPLQMIFLGIGIIGVIYISVNTKAANGKDTLPGIVFLVLAVIAGSLFTVFSRKSSGHFNAMEVTYTSALLGVILFNGANLVRHAVKGDLSAYFAPLLNPQNLIGFLYLGIVSTILATALSNFALSRMQSSTFSAFGGLSTITTVVIGVAVGGEKLYYFHYIGGALILIRMIGVSWIAIRRSKKR